MKHDLREYQIKALDAIYESLKEEPLFLFQGITGCGKTLIICRLINRLFKETDKRFLVLINKMELVKQFASTFIAQTEIDQFNIGICSASLNQFDISKRVTISTVQTFVNRIGEYQGCDLLILDECHNASFGTGSQYDVVVGKLREQTPNVRILGTSSTPFRLGFGYIYGDRHIKGGVNLFEKVGHHIKYEELRQQGYLCDLKGKVAHADSLESDLSSLDTTGGDYVLDKLGEIMCRELHLTTAVQAIHEHCMDYKFIAVFCTTIFHAETLCELLGDDATTIHSNLSPLQRQINMADWMSGRKKICTSINILAEGFDYPALDCLVFARPTLSARLFLQAVGRVLRISEGKDHGFLLDLTDNVSRFGLDIDSVRVNIPKSVVKDILKKDPLCKICPSCERECFISIRICPHCGFEWPVDEIVEANRVPDLTDVIFSKSAPKVKNPPVLHDVMYLDLKIHESRKNGKFLGKAIIGYGNPDYPAEVSEFFCFQDWYQGYAVEMARQKWEQLCNYNPFPQSVDEFIEYKDNIVAPIKILLDENDKYPRIIKYLFDDTPFDLLEEAEEDRIAFGDDDIPF